MVRISAVQMAVADSVADNVTKIAGYMEAAKGSDIVCFPETSLTGISRPSYGEVEEAIRALGRTGRSLGMWSIFGGYAQHDGRTFNELYVVSREGSLAHTYRKKHLWNTEVCVTAGTDNHVAETDFGKIGVINCWDIAFPEETRDLAREGAQIVFCPAYWYGKEYRTEKIIEMIPQVLAFLNQAYFVLCDACNVPETAARSRICSPLEVLAEAGAREEIISAEADLGDLKKLREIFDCYPKA